MLWSKNLKMYCDTIEFDPGTLSFIFSPYKYLLERFLWRFFDIWTRKYSLSKISFILNYKLSKHVIIMTYCRTIQESNYENLGSFSLCGLYMNFTQLKEKKYKFSMIITIWIPWNCGIKLMCSVALVKWTGIANRLFTNFFSGFSQEKCLEAAVVMIQNAINPHTNFTSLFCDMPTYQFFSFAPKIRMCLEY